MKLSSPRIHPLQESQWSDAQREMLEPIMGKQPFYNVMGTLCRHVKAAQKFWVWANHIMGDSSTIPARHREILILRVGWLCEDGLTDVEIANIKIGPDSSEWKPFESALLRAADELHHDSCISDLTWATLTEAYNDQQMMDLVFTVGQYHTVSMALNSFGVQLDKGVTGF